MIAAAAVQRKLRMLCLHGYHGSADVLRRQLAAFAAPLAELADFEYIDAPSLAVGDFGWWHAVDAERRYDGWARTREAIVAAFARRGPFDGVLGFSQGAALAGLLVGLRAPDGTPTPERPLAFGVAILASGFPARDPELAQLYARADSYALPSLHLVGRADAVVPAASTRALADRFARPTIVEHAGGHVVPATPAVIEAARALLISFSTTHQEPS